MSSKKARRRREMEQNDLASLRKALEPFVRAFEKSRGMKEYDPSDDAPVHIYVGNSPVRGIKPDCTVGDFRRAKKMLRGR